MLLFFSVRKYKSGGFKPSYSQPLAQPGFEYKRGMLRPGGGGKLKAFGCTSMKAYNIPLYSCSDQSFASEYTDMNL